MCCSIVLYRFYLLFDYSDQSVFIDIILIKVTMSGGFAHSNTELKENLEFNNLIKNF
jgi:hypothetical protein